jgi:hypothetical protein
MSVEFHNEIYNIRRSYSYRYSVSDVAIVVLVMIRLL